MSHPEIPRARVNITLNVETEGAVVQRELPMKCLLLGNFAAAGSSLPLRQRRRYRVTRKNINQVLALLAPTVNVALSSGKRAEIRLQHMTDFHPDALALQIPECRRWLAQRNALKDLKASVIDNPAFRQALTQVLSNENGRLQLEAELQPNANHHEA